MRAAIAAAVVLAAGPAAAQGSRFAVVDVSSGGGNEKIMQAIEQDVARLRPATKPIEDAAMRRLLATGEGPTATATRLVREAQALRATDCAAAAEKAWEAEAATLTSVALDDERELLRRIYVTLVVCEHERGRTAQRDAAARRLRDLVSLPPPGLPQQLWEQHVATATRGQPATELQIDSEPPNAQISVDFHGEGVTPRTLKVPKGTIYVEVQKDGFKKAFRKVEVGTAPARAAFRLIPRSADRTDQALAALGTIRSVEPRERPQSLSRLAQLARAETLVLVAVEGDRAKLWFFDAERGALTGDTIESPIDAATGRVTALASRPTPGAAAPRAPGLLAPVAPPPKQAAGTPAPVASTPEALPEAQAAQQPAVIRRRKKDPTPWWSWVIAGALGAALAAYVIMDQPETKDTLAVRASWDPPPPPTSGP